MLLNFWQILVSISIQPLSYFSRLNLDVNDDRFLLFTECYIRLKWKECQSRTSMRGTPHTFRFECTGWYLCAERVTGICA